MGVTGCPSRVGGTERGVARGGFTLVEVVVAAVVCAMIAAATATAVGQIARVKEQSVARRQAHARADAAASRMALDAVAAVRHHDLRFVKVQVIDGGAGPDQLLVLTRSLRKVRGDDAAEGGIYEVQYRVAPRSAIDPTPTLWRRADPAFDPSLDGGGVAEPAVVGVRELSIAATDGRAWFDAWDSDADGVPHGLRITAVGVSDDGKVTAVARRAVSLDQVPVPPETEEAGTTTGSGSSAGTTGGTTGGSNSGGGGR